MTTMIRSASATASQPVQTVDSGDSTAQSAGNFAAILQNSHNDDSKDPAAKDPAPPQSNGANSLLTTAIASTSAPVAALVDNLGASSSRPTVAASADPDTAEATSPATKHRANDAADAQLSAQTADAILAMAQGLPVPAALPLPPIGGLITAQPATTNTNSDAEIATVSSTSVAGTTGTVAGLGPTAADLATPSTAVPSTAVPSTAVPSTAILSKAIPGTPPPATLIPATTLTAVSPNMKSSNKTAPDATGADATVPDATVPDATTSHATVPDAVVPDATVSLGTSAPTLSRTRTDQLNINQSEAAPATLAVDTPAIALAVPVVTGVRPASVAVALPSAPAGATPALAPVPGQGNDGTSSDPSTSGGGTPGRGQAEPASTAYASTANASTADASNATAIAIAIAASATATIMTADLAQSGLLPAPALGTSHTADKLNTDAITSLSSQAITAPIIASTALAPVAAAQSPAGGQPLYEQLAAPVLHVVATGDGVNTIVVQLHPQDLGSVGAEIALHNGRISVVLSAGSDLTRATINAALPALHQQLANAGLTDIKLAVDSSVPPSATAGSQLSNAQSQGSQDGSPQSRAARHTNERSVSTSALPTDARPAPTRGRRLSTSGVDRWL